MDTPGLDYRPTRPQAPAATDQAPPPHHLHRFHLTQTRLCTCALGWLQSSTTAFHHLRTKYTPNAYFPGSMASPGTDMFLSQPFLFASVCMQMEGRQRASETAKRKLASGERAGRMKAAHSWFGAAKRRTSAAAGGPLQSTQSVSRDGCFIRGRLGTLEGDGFV